jgi:hypothetical protein
MKKGMASPKGIGVRLIRLRIALECAFNKYDCNVVAGRRDVHSNEEEVAGVSAGG